MTRQTRFALTLAAALSAGLLAGCPPVTKPLDTQPASIAQTAPADPGDAPILGVEPTARNAYIAVDRRTPLTEKTLARARMTRAEVQASLQAALSVPTTAPASTAPAFATASAPSDEYRDADPPPQAVKHYLQGRQRYLEGANSEATAALEKALQLDPQAFTVLRLMGRVCFANAQLARGAMYLERAQALHPRDVEVNYLLGRYWIERNDFDKASHCLLAAVDSPERQVTSVFTPSSAFYLGVALQLGGYHLAAAREYERFLELVEMPIPGYRYDGELNHLINQRWASHLAAAENFARLADYHAAVPHYRAAAAARPDDVFIASRFVNALVHDRQPAPAQQAAMALVATGKGGDDGVKLLAWTYQAAGRQADLLTELGARLKSAAPASQQAAAITLSTAQEFLGRKLDALATLAGFLDAHPDNLDVLGRLLKRVDSAPALALALNATAAALDARRDDAMPVLRLLVPVAESQAGAAYVNAALARQGTASGPLPLPVAARPDHAYALYYLEAFVRLEQNLPAEHVEAAFEASVKADGRFFLAAQEYVSYLLTREKFTKASAAIDTLMQGHESSARAWRLQIDAQAAQQRYVRALQLAQEACAKFPDDLDLRMQLVGIYRVRGQDAQADAELQAILKDHPKYENAYRSLVKGLLDRLNVPGSNAATILGTVVPTLNKMATEIPDSRFGRVASAVIFARGGRFEDAETLLRTVLAREPDDSEGLVLLSYIQDRTGRTKDAIALLESALRRKAQVDVARSLAQLYRDDNRAADALALVSRLAQENPDAEIYVLLHARELSTQEKRADALALMAQARTRFPRSQNVAMQLARLQDEADDHEGAIATMRQFMKAHGETTDGLYLLSHFYSAAGNDDACVAALQRLLTIMPDNIGANNDLGYFWADAGIQLEQAEPMIKKALENKPDNPAFLDSLGWLYYKQGKFQDARTLLQKALALPNGSAPEVIRHLADTLYRLGHEPEAVVQWEKALQLLNISEKLSSGDRKERDYLTKCLSESRAGRKPDVSPIATPAPVDDRARAVAPANTATTLPRN